MPPTPKPLRHGTLHAYQVRGCRCADCRRAKAEAKRHYQRPKPARIRWADRFWLTAEQVACVERLAGLLRPVS